MCKGKQFSRMEKVILVLQSSLSIATLWQNIVNSELYLLTHCIGWFPIAAVTNDHKLTGLSNAHLLSHSSGGQKLELGLTGLRSKC